MSDLTAVVLAPLGVGGSLGALIERLRGAGIEVAVVDDVTSAAEIARASAERPPVLLMDLRDVTEGAQLEDAKRAADTIRRAVAAIPIVSPIAITAEADAGMIVAFMRAGAGDVLDFRLEGTANAPAVVQRVFLRQLEIARQLGAAAALREMIEDLLKDLIRTERRSIDLEEQLAASNRPRQPRPRTESGVDAAVLIVEHERELADALADELEGRGLTTYAYVTGEDAVHDIEQLVAEGHAPDLAVVAAELPGIDGFETLVRLRLHLPGLAAFLVTAVRDEEVAARAADLGVVGFAHKPLQSVPEVADRLARLAREGLQRTREHLYLARIKERHEHVLARYRSLPRPA